MATAQSTHHSQGRSRTIQIGIIVVALAAAGFFTWRAMSDGAGPTTSSTTEAYMCQACGNVVNMKPDDYHRLASKRDNRRNNDDGPARGGSSTPVCEKCREGNLVSTTRCPKDGTIVPRFSKDWRAGKCPKCGWVRQAS